MKYISLSTFLLLHLFMHSQIVQGVVLDSISKENLPYANLVIKEKNIGAYSDDNGNYHIDISKALNKDTLVVSLIGYETQKIPISRFNDGNDHRFNFQLVHKTEALEEILILSKTKTYGNNKVELSTGNRKRVFPSSATYGYEIATLIDNPKLKKGKLVSLQLKFRNRINEDYKAYLTYYRLAFYTIDNLGFPGDLLNFTDIIIKPEKEARNYKIDLEDKNIQFTEKGIFIGIETIQPNFVKPDNSMYLTTPNLLYTHTEKNIKYSRFGSNTWTNNSKKSVFKKKLYAVPFIKVNVVFEKE